MLAFGEVERKGGWGRRPGPRCSAQRVTRAPCGARPRRRGLQGWRGADGPPSVAVAVAAVVPAGCRLHAAAPTPARIATTSLQLRQSSDPARAESLPANQRPSKSSALEAGRAGERGARAGRGAGPGERARGAGGG